MDDDGRRVKVTEIRRNPSVALPPNIKSGNYLNNIVALREANADGYEDCLMLNTDDTLSELSRSNMWYEISKKKTVN